MKAGIIASVYTQTHTHAELDQTAPCAKVGG
jgi:hypothetical protein